MRYRLSQQARSDLKDILIEGILNWGDTQSLRYQDSFRRTFELLASMPTLGRRSERGYDDEHRFLHGKHVIYYRIEPDQIVIQTIIYGGLITDLWGDG